MIMDILPALECLLCWILERQKALLISLVNLQFITVVVVVINFNILLGVV